MSDAAQPTAAEVRTAAEAVKAALDRHLAAVEQRSGEDDPAVYEAFNELAAAAEEYDEVLYDRYDEVTPFEIPGAEDPLPPYTGPREPTALSVLVRRDYAVAEPQRLLAQAGRIEAFEDDEGDGGTRGDGEGADGSAADTVHGALGILFGEYDPDEIAARHREFGLEEGDSTLWVTAADDLPEPGSWLDAPFDQADSERVVCRFDVSTAFDDAEEAADGDLDDDGLDDPDDLDEDDPEDDPDDDFDDGEGDGEDAYGAYGPDAYGDADRADGGGAGRTHGPAGAVGFDDRGAAARAAAGAVADDDDLERL